LPGFYVVIVDAGVAEQPLTFIGGNASAESNVQN
jgi:hypothetical protein